MANGWTGGQYSVFRVLLGTWLAVDGAMLGASAGSVAGLVLAILAVVAAAAVMAGYWDRAAALVVAAVLMGLAAIRPMGQPGLMTAGQVGVPVVLCVLHSLTMGGPYGSWAARGRSDPAGQWRMPAAVFAGFWWVLSLSYLSGGISFSLSESWHLGTGLLSMHSGLPMPAVRAMTWVIFASYLAFAPVVLVKRFRPWAWGWLVVVNSVIFSLAGLWPVAVSLGLAHLMTLDPRWIPGKAAQARETMFYDGHCGLCHRWVRFVLAEDASGQRFVLSPLQGEFIKNQLSEAQRANLPDSIVVQTATGQLLTESRAVLHIMARLGGMWRIISAAAWLIPRFFRDAVYRGVARVRHRLFAQPAAACPIVPEPLRQRFLH